MALLAVTVFWGLNAKIDALDFNGEKIASLRDLPLVLPILGYICHKFPISIELAGRGSSVLFYVGTFITLFFWLKRYFTPRTLTFILFAFAFLPMTIIYYQSFILEPSALFFFCVGMLCLEKEFLALGMFLIGVSFASRVEFCAFALPLIYFLHIRKINKFWLLIALAIPFFWQVLAWGWANLKDTQSSLAVNSTKYFDHTIMLNPDFYRKIFDDLTTVVFNPIGFTLAILGAIWWRGNLFFPLCLISILLLVLLVPMKFYRHDYYFFPVILPGSVFIGSAIEKICQSLYE